MRLAFGVLRAALTIILAGQLGAASLRAQTVPVGDPLEDYTRVLSLLRLGPDQSFLLRPLGTVTADVGPWRDRLRLDTGRVEWLAPTLRLFENSAFPGGVNDGAVWQGRGLTLAAEGGATARVGALTISIRPRLIWTQNRAFALRDVTDSGRTRFADPFHPRNGAGSWIDRPQRFGPDAFWTLDPGQTSVRAAFLGLQAGAGTENRWWGPGRRNALLLSNHAGGFPHAWLATGRPRDVGIGRLEAHWLWGRLTGSEWSDSVVADTARYITGLAMTLSPVVFRGLHLGGARMFYLTMPPGGLSFGEYFLVWQRVTKAGLADSANPLGDDARDQLLSLFARWAPPGSGFEAFVEWARNDHNWDIRDFLLEPEHSQAYTLGFQAVRPLRGNRLLRVGGELTHLERSGTQQVRATPTYYAHHLVLEGYTNRGQIIGAGIGPGSNSQAIDLDVFTPWGRVGGHVSRVVHDNDAYYTYVGDSITFRQHHITLAAGVSALVFRGDFDLSGTLEVARDLNRYFILENDVTNLRVELLLRWHPRRRLN